MGVVQFEALLAHEAPQWWERALLQLFMQWQYNKYAQPHLPADFQEEMAGLGDGAAGVGVPEAETYAQVGVALSSIATGDVAKDIIYLLKSELLPGVSDVKKALLAEGVSLEEAAARVGGSRLLQVGKTCSFFGVWGDRTQQGQLFSGRNLDWAAQTGVARYKTINVYHIGESHSYASVSFAGLVGAITGSALRFRWPSSTARLTGRLLRAQCPLRASPCTRPATTTRWRRLTASRGACACAR